MRSDQGLGDFGFFEIRLPLPLRSLKNEKFVFRFFFLKSSDSFFLSLEILFCLKLLVHSNIHLACVQSLLFISFRLALRAFAFF